MVTKTITDKKLHVRFDNGTTASGAKSVKAVNLTHVSLTASDEDMMAAGEAYAALTERTLDSIRMTDLYDMTREGE